MYRRLGTTRLRGQVVGGSRDDPAIVLYLDGETVLTPEQNDELIAALTALGLEARARREKQEAV